jgi:hypothetical protein
VKQMRDIMSIVHGRAVTGSQWNFISLLLLSGVHLSDVYHTVTF